MEQLIDNNPFILMEGAIAEPLKRDYKTPMHPQLVHSAAIYNTSAREALRELYQGYIDVAQSVNVPIILLTPTFRANAERIRMASGMQHINSDAVQFLKDIRSSQNPDAAPIKIGGMIACKNDAYSPQLGLSAIEAEHFHEWQLTQLVDASPDYLIAQTLPAIDEAIGIARAMAKTNLPYIISFVINRNACLLDGTNLAEAITEIDQQTKRQPLMYMVNCSYPTFICAKSQPKSLFTRLLGYQANASSLDHDKLDGAPKQKTEDLAQWGNTMAKLYHDYGMKIMGGCCGTRKEHLKYLVSQIIGAGARP